MLGAATSSSRGTRAGGARYVWDAALRGLTASLHAPFVAPVARRRYTNVEQHFRRAFPETWEASALPTDEELGRRIVQSWRTATPPELSDSVCLTVGTLWPVVTIQEVGYFLQLLLPPPPWRRLLTGACLLALCAGRSAQGAHLLAAVPFAAPAVDDHGNPARQAVAPHRYLSVTAALAVLQDLAATAAPLLRDLVRTAARTAAKAVAPPALTGTSSGSLAWPAGRPTAGAGCAPRWPGAGEAGGAAGAPELGRAVRATAWPGPGDGPDPGAPTVCGQACGRAEGP